MKLFKINTFFIMLLVILLAFAGFAENAGAFTVASSRYYCSTPTITLEVKPPTALFAPLIPPESGDAADKPVSSDITIPDDEEQVDNDMGNNTVSEDHEAGQQTGQSDGSTREDESEAVAIHHNALIISRLIPEDHSLHTEINVDSITSSNQVFIDVFSGDQEAETEADSVFISFENENGTVQTVRIGLDEQIDNITVLDGISGETSQQTASSQDEFNHIDSFLELEQIRSPVIVVIPDTNERIYFSNGSALLNHVFQEQYMIESVRAVRDEMEIRLIKK